MRVRMGGVNGSVNAIATPMEMRILAALVLVTVIWLVSLVGFLINPGEAQSSKLNQSLSLPQVRVDPRPLWETATARGGAQLMVAACKSQPEIEPHLQVERRRPIIANRRKQTKDFKATPDPKQVVALAHPTNYGERFAKDVKGRFVNNQPIVVLHETVGSASSAINLFQTPHPRDEDQASYHALIAQDGTIVYLVPPDKRAFGAGNSLFSGPQGIEGVQTNP
ncbi:MAG: peptidoglycan recognition family protein, partial [Leptolyngbyaceae bacterium]|nr:peptidoglycan recognition family protein [Leptolyngbyaceae bacterium]